jgi:hypothetical protein
MTFRQDEQVARTSQTEEEPTGIICETLLHSKNGIHIDTLSKYR